LPITIGGEVAVASPAAFKELYSYTLASFKEVVKRAQAGTLPGGERGVALINTDETLLTMSVGRQPNVGFINPFIKRIYNLGFINNLKKGDEKLAIWHLPGEKHRGLSNLYEFIVEKDPRFWEAGPEERAKFMGDVLAVPKRRIRRSTDPTFFQEQVRILRGRAGMARNKIYEILGIYHH
jgi:hypothetical protein